MNQLEQALTRIYQCTFVRCIQTQGMWLIEMVIPNITQQQKMTAWAQLPQQVQQALGPGNQIWKAFIYAKEADRYTAQGTLHVLQAQWQNGMVTTTLSALDSYTDISEFDAELIQMGAPAGHVIHAKESIDAQGQPILAYQQGANHTWIEAMGGAYQLANNGVRLTNNQHPYTMRITLQ